MNLNALMDIERQVAANHRRWLITGSAGFIGSHLLETLLRLEQEVTSLDNFSTGHRSNLDEVRRIVGENAWSRHRFIEGDITDLVACRDACRAVDVVLHHAALGSVPRSIEDPLATHHTNATGFLAMLTAARDAKVGRFIYAASSSTYGDSPTLPKVESRIGRPLSPYAVTKYFNELYAEVFGRCYGLSTIGLRYFNVFGARQDPRGAYAAVIPRWARSMIDGVVCAINGDGMTSRDFCYVANVVQANLRAATTQDPDAADQIFNVAVGQSTSLAELHRLLAMTLKSLRPHLTVAPPEYRSFRAGDIAHSLADISKARHRLGYLPTHDVQHGLMNSLAWYLR